MGTALKIQDDLTPLELRRWARGKARGRPAARAYGIANALEGMTRGEAARLAGMERQALRDAVVRYNAEGLSGRRGLRGVVKCWRQAVSLGRAPPFHVIKGNAKNL